MATTSGDLEIDSLRELRARSQAEDGVFWVHEGELGVFDPEAAQHVNEANFQDLTLRDRLIDQLLRRKSPPVSWKDVRGAWSAQLRRLSDGEGIGRLAGRMSALIDERLDRPVDLVWATQEVCIRSLLPMVISGLSPADTARILRDQTLKLAPLLATGPVRRTVREALRSGWVQAAAGQVVRRELRGRASGRRPRQLDITDPIVDMLPSLGMDRAVYALTAVLTAISGPPGAAATCMLYELIHRPEWAERLAGELGPLRPEELYEAPTLAAPITHRFVKETLRVWSPPLILTRIVRTDICVRDARLKEDERYLLSPFLIHHDPRHWKDPDVFDPDRWLPGAGHGPCSHATYVPFGWSPKSCIGASLGTTQLIVLCHLMLTRYRVELSDPGSVRMGLAAMARPLRFHGSIFRRTRR